MSKKYVALGGNVFVKEIKREIETGVLLIPDGFNADYTYGTVVSVGEGYFERGNFVPVNVAVDDEIMFPKAAGNKVVFPDGTEVLMVNHSDIMAKLVETLDIEE